MKILFVSTVSNTVNTFLIPHIRMLRELGHEVDVAFNIVQDVHPELARMGCEIYNLEFNRSPLKKQNYIAYKKLKKIIEHNNYDVVHTHTPVASACVRFACKTNSSVQVVYTAHGFHFFKGAPFLNWMIYYPIERWLARYTDVIITINSEDYFKAKNSLKARKIEYVPGVGINTQDNDYVSINKTEKLRALGLPEEAFILLSIGELNKNKNHETVIKALAKLNKSNAYYVICGEGGSRKYLEKLIVSHGLENKVKLLGFRTDVDTMYKLADVFVFPSFREGLSVSLMEAMANGVPVVGSDIRGNSDLIEDGKEGYLKDPNDIEGFMEAISTLMNDKTTRNKFGVESKKKIKTYDYSNVLKDMEKIYLTCT
ncbi:glycosyltransferase family 4 protein [Salimicrobium humidisoli]|uniref:Glycosyltransferase family 1 protein n=1 Tax=Salimicrobium humidisoli TaxID=2029857 RepID=A0ABX4HUD5_9BACI|nr:glycosyltransferase family 4 protein [Salimicrobium humidisoli]PBB06452.1 glycosyltransferase family 1 protein [Salimicrobium humidisoli]